MSAADATPESMAAYYRQRAADYERVYAKPDRQADLRAMEAWLPGVFAGSLLVFILSMGYYITPALLGGPQEQMASYFIAFYTNETINWGMAAALSTVLLGATLLLYVVYSRYAGQSRTPAKTL